MDNLCDVKIKKYYHSFFLINLNNEINVITDPFFGQNLPQNLKLDINVLDIASLPKIDLILLTQEHFDHFDKEAIESIVKLHNCVVVGPRHVLLNLDLPTNNLRYVKVDDKLLVSRINLSVLPCQCPRSFYSVGYLLSYKDFNIYFSGETLSLPEVPIKAKIGIMPSGAFHMADYHVFISMAKKLNLEFAIPMMYNTFVNCKIDLDKFKEKASDKFKTTKLILLDDYEEFDPCNDI